MTDVYIQATIIVKKLVHAGHIAYFAGGWVRDYVMGHPSEDIDIATSASPAQIMDLFPRTILVGLSFGVVIVVMEGHQFEVATFRKDLRYIDGRHPEGIELSTSPRDDALRRDFTINGMFYDPIDQTIHDFVQGQDDIKRQVIRTIGDPQERFFEDRLRMLRAFRFAARFSFSIDPETQEAICENAEKLFPAVAMERVWQEFNKMAAYPRFDQAIVEMHRLEILDVIFPELADMHLNELKHLVQPYSHFPSNTPPILYLMEFFPKATLEEKIEISKRIKATNRDIKLIEFFQQLNQAIKQPSDDWQWAHLMAHPDYDICLHVFAARLQEREAFLQQCEERFERLRPHVHRIQEGKPLVTAMFLQQKGIKPGKKMGLLLKEAESLAINRNLHQPELILQALMQTPIWEQP